MPDMIVERRMMPGAFELRAEGDAESRRIEGYAVVFNSRTELWPDLFEEIMPGAFTGSIADGDDVRALFNHDRNMVLARTKAKTLELKEDEKGLWYGFDAPETGIGNDLLVSIRRGDISQSSFGFSVVREEFIKIDERKVLRKVHEARLYDVSPVTYPAYEDTEVMVRAALTHAPAEIMSRYGAAERAARQRINELRIRNII